MTITTPFAAAVLAGGRASRMGTDKAFFVWRGQRLLDRQLNLLSSLGPVELLLSGRRGVDYGVARAQLVHDLVPDQGPLGGLVAVMESTEAPHVVVLAVDMPTMTAEFMRRLLARRRSGVGVVVRTASSWEPLAALYPREILPLLRERLARQELALQQLIESAVAAGLLVPMDVSPAEMGLFANLNTPADVTSLGQENREV